MLLAEKEFLRSSSLLFIPSMEFFNINLSASDLLKLSLIFSLLASLSVFKLLKVSILIVLSEIFSLSFWIFWFISSKRVFFSKVLLDLVSRLLINVFSFSSKVFIFSSIDLSSVLRLSISSSNLPRSSIFIFFLKSSSSFSFSLLVFLSFAKDI